MKVSIEQPQLDQEKTFQEVVKFRDKIFYPQEEIELELEDIEFVEENAVEVPEVPVKRKEVFGKKHFDGDKFKKVKVEKEENIESFVFSVQSETHEKNEDYVFVDIENQIAILCDGMGGLGHGDYASKKMAEGLSKEVSSINFAESEKKVIKKVEKAIKKIGKTIDKGGTTLSFVKVFIDKKGKKKALIVNVGDSKIFKRDSLGKLKELTTEQTAWTYLLENVKKTFGVLELLYMTTFAKLNKKNLNYISKSEYGKMMKEIYSQKNPNLFLTKKVEEYYSKSMAQVQKEKDKYFNFYCELSRFSEGITNQDTNYIIETKVIDLEVGDLVFATCDGVHDNLLTSEIEKTLKTGKIEELTDVTKKAYQKSMSKLAIAKQDDISAVGFKIAA